MLAVVYSLLFRHIPINSDCANYFLQAQDIHNGNLFLKHWILTLDTYYSVDTILLAIGMLIVGPSLKLLYIIPAIVFALMVLLTLVLSKYKSVSVFSFCFVFIMLGLPTLETASLSFGLVSYHAASLMYCLLILFCIVHIKKPALKTAVCFALTYIVCMGDPWIDFVLVLPLLILWGLEKYNKRDSLANLPLIILSAAVLAHLTVWLFSHMYPLTIVATNHNISKPKECLLALFFLGLNYANLAGIQTQLPHYFIIIRELGLIIMLLGLLKTLKDWKKQDWLNQFLAISILSLSGAYIFGETSLGSYFSNAPVDPFSARYLISSYVFGVILALRALRPETLIKTERARDIKALLVFFLILNLFYFIPLLFTPKSEPPIMPAIEWLENHGYTNGYANYWEASSVTVMTSGKLSVRAIINFSDENTPILPQGWLVNTDWYAEAKRPNQGNFVIFNNANPARMNVETLTLNFGKPEQVIVINGYTIVIWSKNIAPAWPFIMIG
jgi:hypothetical protein